MNDNSAYAVGMICLTIIFVALLYFATAAHAQTAIISPSLTGVGCQCNFNGKTWPCRKVKGYPPGDTLATVNRCWGGGTQLSCPEDKQAVCQYVLVPPICTEPPLTDVCYAGDEPK